MKADPLSLLSGQIMTIAGSFGLARGDYISGAGFLIAGLTATYFWCRRLNDHLNERTK